MTFTIDTDNNIAAHAGQPASAENVQSFASYQELARLADAWPAARLLEIWNSFAGVAPFDDLRPVKKFTTRKIAVARIWAAIQRLSADDAIPARDVAPAAKPTKSALKVPRRARGQRVATESAGNKKADVIALMKRAKGAQSGAPSAAIPPQRLSISPHRAPVARHKAFARGEAR